MTTPEVHSSPSRNFWTTCCVGYSYDDTSDASPYDAGASFEDEELVTLEEFESLTPKRRPRLPDGPIPLQRLDGPDKPLPKKSPQRKRSTRRRPINPATCDRDYSDDELEFMNALDEYKRNSGRIFPTCCEILGVLKTLGYEKSGEWRVESGE